MVTNSEEIAIISRARQKNVADPARSREHFCHIFEDFLVNRDLRGQEVLDLGPGQWDFGELCRERGVRTVVGIDSDPAVIELGRYKGFTALEGDLKRPWEIEGMKAIDGLFCKFSINAFWHADDEFSAQRMIRLYLALVKPGGWAWVAPWNGVPKTLNASERVLSTLVEQQRIWFEEAGFRARELTRQEAIRYGVHGEVFNSPLFTKL